MATITMDVRTAVRRILEETHKEGADNETLAKLALVKAHVFYEPQRFYFTSVDTDFTIVTDENEYDREEHWQFMERLESVWIEDGDNWLPLIPTTPTEFQYLDRQDDTLYRAKPRYYTMNTDKVYLYPIPDKDYDARVKYVKKSDIFISKHDGSSWTHYRNGQEWTDGESSQLLVHAPELVIARAKWDLYFNFYDDAENAQKMQMLVDLELARQLKRAHNLSLNIQRQVQFV